MTEPRHIRVHDTGEVLVIEFRDSRIPGELAMSFVGPELQEATARSLGRRVVLDLTGVEFISSVMLGKILALNKRLAAGGGRLVLCGLGETVDMIFRSAQLDQVLTIRETQVDATALCVQEG